MRSFSGRRLVLATANPGKLREMRDILGPREFSLCGLADLPPVALPDEGDDYLDNAVAKARAAAQQLGEPALADDSGLEVEGLGGAPGARSARYGGPGLDDAGRVARLLDALADDPSKSRRARFVCHLALVTPDGEVATAFGECRGTILETARGRDGFGYDPIFQLDGTTVSLAELSPGEKNRVSHRARALAAMFGPTPRGRRGAP